LQTQNRASELGARAGERSAVAAGGVLVLMASLIAVRADDVAPPSSDLGRESQSLKSVCTKCHNLQIVMDTPMSYDAWHETVQLMVDRGATGTDDQFDDIMDYLHRTMTTFNVNSVDADELQLLLNVPKSVANAIVERRSRQRFSDLADLKTVQGIDAVAVDAKTKLIFFN
jgi:competence protein ComEA